MKYSLRSLMIVVTLVCVVLGGRTAYLRQWAVFHQAEAKRHFAYFEKDSMSLEGVQHIRRVDQHLTLAKRFESAVNHPWVIVDARVSDGTLPHSITSDRRAWRLSGDRYVSNP